MKWLIFLLVPLSMGCFVYSGIPSHVETRSLDLDAAGLTTLYIESGAGFLKVMGETGRSRISVTAEIQVFGIPAARAPEFLDRYLDLTLTRTGDSARLRGRMKQNISGFFDGPRARIHLTVRIPAHLAVDIEDGSGPIDVQHVGGRVRIEDGSGAIELRDLDSGVEITDSSGSITLSDIRGPVRVKDGSGSVQMTHVTGDIWIHDGSGSIRIEDVTGTVVLRDGSGSITVRNVRGNVTLEEDGSGAVTIANVSGTVQTLPK